MEGPARPGAAGRGFWLHSMPHVDETPIRAPLRSQVKAKRRDRAARWVITIGGVAVIATVVAMLVLILRVAAPLFAGSSATLVRHVDPGPIAGDAVLAVGMDDYLENGYVIAADGRIAFYDLGAGTLRETRDLSVEENKPRRIVTVDSWGDQSHTLRWDDGAVSIIQVRFRPRHDEAGVRAIEYSIERLAVFEPAARMPRMIQARVSPDGRLTRVDLDHDGRLTLLQQVKKQSLLGGAGLESFDAVLAQLDQLNGVVTALRLDSAGRYLYAGTNSGRLYRWDLSGPGAPVLRDDIAAFEDGRAVTALNLVFGDVSLAVGDERGGLSTWFAVRPDETSLKQLRRIHVLPAHDAPISRITTNRRNKTLLSLSADGAARLTYATSERLLVSLPGPLSLAALSNRGNGLIGLTRDGRLDVWAVDNPHPEVSARTLFGKVWYENYDAPAYTWQSSSPVDEFEPKFSLMPLIFGSLKGTIYAMLFAVPLAILGAVYTSEFTTPRFRALIKPVVEIMAAIPSVVVGFLVALWLAPLVEGWIVSFFLALMFVPLVFLVFIAGWLPFSQSRFARRVHRGYEFVLAVPVILVGCYLAALAGPAVEEWFFAGDFQQWLYDTVGERYDQRNAIIIAFGLGFAVIPIIFTLAEDALTAVPGRLKAASLALGASRWQTVWRVVLPSASPGIFAGIIIGFGRAVGETMIVLMATGNTPIMDWSPFNGMRTLSANIAVEIPEAPVGGTLYRVLFLSAVILFLLTSVLNTAAEMIRHQLRKKYGRFE